jgi:hypothetical protein
MVFYTLYKFLFGFGIYIINHRSIVARLSKIMCQHFLSGTSIQSKYTISKTGSKLYRGMLFMGVFSAIRFDENFKSFYDRLIANGKHTTQAQIAVMRKIIITAHSLYQNDKKYDMNFGKPKATDIE